MDVHSKKQRSYNMSQIKGMHTKPELVIAKLLKDLKIPFKTHLTSLPGKPDFFIKDLNLVIEVYGCFWHGHKHCRYFVKPKSNRVFWLNKIKSNIKRDELVRTQIEGAGLRFKIIWECEIKDGSFLEKLLQSLTSR